MARAQLDLSLAAPSHCGAWDQGWGAGLSAWLQSHPVPAALPSRTCFPGPSPAFQHFTLLGAAPQGLSPGGSRVSLRGQTDQGSSPSSARSWIADSDLGAWELKC